MLARETIERLLASALNEANKDPKQAVLVVLASELQRLMFVTVDLVNAVDDLRKSIDARDDVDLLYTGGRSSD